MNGSVEYSANSHGYKVRVIKDEEIVEEYYGSNSRLDSVQSVALDSPHCISLGQIRDMAKETAYEMAKTYRISANNVQENPTKTEF